MSKVTQKQRVLDAMKNHKSKSISTWYAFKHLGNTRLAASIHNLKKDGHIITSTIETGTNRFGDQVKYARYTLIQEAK